MLHLITTADERVYNYKKPVLFLGEWCKPYLKKSVWLINDSITVEPFGVGLETKQANISYIQETHNAFLSILSTRLNKLNNTFYSERYYNIILGHWLYRFLSVVFNRYSNIEYAFDNYNISSTSKIELEESFSFVTNNSQEFLNIVNDDLWNHNLYLRIIDYLEYNISVEKIKSKKLKIEKKIIKNSFFKKIKNYIVESYNYLSKIFSKKNDAFIINSYLSRFQEMKLQILLFQFPSIWKSPQIKISKEDKILRERLNDFSNDHKCFESCAKLILFEMLPKCYLEGSKELLQECQRINWPKYPKFILTSNNFDTDEFFKYWTANKVDQGVPYIVCQHGNNYGTYFGNNNWPERTTPDKFITWGWEELDSNTISGFNFKISKKIKIDNFNRANIYLFLLHQPYRCHPEDNYFEFTEYQNDQFDFVKKLSNQVKSKLFIRLHSSSVNFDWSEKKRWEEFDNQLNLIDSNIPFSNLMKKSKILIFSYDSTGFLESLMLNIPTIAFWREESNNLILRASVFYNLLKDSKILFTNPKDAADFISTNWETIDKWWSSENVQNAREVFCNQFSRFEGDPVKKLLKLVNGNEK